MPTNTPPLSNDTTVHTLIIDTDPGADDVIALLLAMASPERLKIQALTTVAGNVPLAKTSRNARLAREWGQRPDIPVYGGAQRPLLRTPIYAADIHGSEGITDVQVHEPAQPLAEGHAVDYLIDTLRAAPDKSVTLAMLGPQTNLALALAQAPDIVRGLRELVLMAGAHFNGGNITPTAEFNVFADPHAAEIVLGSGVPITMLPLDLTHKVLATPEFRDRVLAQGNELGGGTPEQFGAFIKTENAKWGGIVRAAKITAD